jgi:hypothetical protein
VAWTCWAAAKTVRARLRPSNSLENILVFLIVVSSLVSKILMQTQKETPQLDFFDKTLLIRG